MRDPQEATMARTRSTGCGPVRRAGAVAVPVALPVALLADVLPAAPVYINSRETATPPQLVVTVQ